MRASIALVLMTATVAEAGETHQVSFDDGLPKKWHKTIGSWEVKDGVLVGREVEEDEHAAASRYLIPLTDGEVAFRFKLNDAKVVSFGFDPAKGALKKKGHLYSAVVTRNAVALNKHKDKADPKSKNETKDRKKITIDPDEWVNVKITLVGETSTVQIGDVTLKGSDPEFAVAKPGVVFRVSKGTAYFDDVVVKPIN